MKSAFYIACGFLAAGLAITSQAQSTQTQLERILFKQLSSSYPGARIEMLGLPRGISISSADRVAVIDQINDDGTGNVAFRYRVENGVETGYGSIAFRAWKPAWVSMRRIRPGEKLSRDSVELRELDVASGPGREVRAQLVIDADQIEKFETRQTILEGYPVLSQAVERAPDIRRGDVVRVRLVVGEVTLSTHGVASEPGRSGDSLTVVTQGTKKSLSGTVSSDRTVEVRL
ncbi:MAG: flagellar basal body P-ring formation protein FlgA [Bdellovibrionales bacterium]|nr:flagellar basal body P-ring formation protein FlgA [Bdellovibrionales bacterium]